MDDKMSNRVNMISATHVFCTENAAETASVPAILTIVTNVGNRLVLINSLNQISVGTSEGVTLDTNLLRATMVNLAFKCASGTATYASISENNTLAALVKVNLSDLGKTKKADIDDVCQNIHDAADTNIANLADYGILPADVTALQTSIDIYRASFQNPRQAIIDKKQANKQIRENVKYITKTLFSNQLDNLFNLFLTTNPQLVSAYKDARMIIDLGTTNAKIRGTVLDINDVPLQNVEVKVVSAGTQNVIKSVFTDIKGKYSVTKLPAGFVDITWRLAGYDTITENNLKIVAGREYQRKKVMIQSVV